MDWGALYGLVITATGWTLPVVDALTMDEANDLLGYWRSYPPVHLLVRGFVGMEDPPATGGSGGKASADGMTTQEMTDLVAMLNGR